VALDRPLRHLPGLIIPYLTFSLPLAIYALTAFFREIPWELEQAAQVDGATPFQAVHASNRAARRAGHVSPPAILVFIFCLERLPLRDLADHLGRVATVPGGALPSSPAKSAFTAPTGSIAAAAVVVTVPIIVFVLVLPAPHRLRLTAGAVKG
jgi:multiple sugar transport system permease protein